MIKLHKILLKNFRGFKEIEITFEDHITCIAGINGAGKTTILQAIAKSLSLLANKASLTNKKNYSLGKNDIHRENFSYEDFSGNAELKASFCIDKEEYITDYQIEYYGKKVSSVTKAEKVNLIEKTDYPVFSYYTATRDATNMVASINKEVPAANVYDFYSDINTEITKYDDFFTWFRRREDIENERLLMAHRNNIHGYDYDIELEAVRYAIEAFFGKKYKMHVNRTENLLLVDNAKQEISFSNLSDGEKSIILLIGDIARKLAITSSVRFKDLPTNVKDIINSNGIILIDEIEMHLHPSWQRRISKFLVDTFPNCQFIITTHSPQVLGELKTNEIWLLNNFTVYRPTASYGLTSNQILDEVMDVIEDDKTLSRNSIIAEKISNVSMLVEEEKFSEAKKVIDEIETIAGGELPETAKYKTVIDMVGEE